MQSFVLVTADSHFPIQNLPYGVFRRRSGGRPTIGVAIGDCVLDLAVLEQEKLLPSFGVFQQSTLNAFMAAGKEAWRQTRGAIGQLLRHDEPTLRDNAQLRDRALVPMADVEMLLPCDIGDYTDFYSSSEHATNVGTMLRGTDNALAAELAAPAGGLSRPGQLGRRQRHRPAPATRPDQGRHRRVAQLRAQQGGRFRAGDGLLHRPRQSARPADPDRPGRGPHLRHGAGQRLERPRHPEVGVPAARAVPGQELRHVDLAVGRAAGRARAVSPCRPEAGPAAAALPGRETATRRSTFTWKFSCRASASAPRTSAISTGTCASSWPTTRSTAATCGPATCWRPARSAGRRRIPTAACWSWPGAARSRSSLPNGERRVFLQDGDRVTMTGWCQGDGYRVGFGEVTGRILSPVPGV